MPKYILICIADLEKVLKEPRNLYRTMEEDAYLTEHYTSKMAAKLFLNVVDHIRANKEYFRCFNNGYIEIPFDKVNKPISMNDQTICRFIIGKLNEEEIEEINTLYRRYDVPMVLG